MDTSTPNSISSILGRQLPHSIENEQALLGALILDSERIGDVSAVISTDDFYIEKHAQIYSALLQLSMENRGVDVVTLLTILVKNGVYTEESGSSYIRQLAENVPSLSNVMDYAAIVHEKAVLRSLIRASEEIMQDAYEQKEDANAVLNEAERKVFALTKGTVREDFTRIDEIIQRFYVELQALAAGDENGSAVQTYYQDIDRVLVGMNPGNLIVIGGRPGMGKTSFAMNIATEVAKRRRDKAVAIFSLEMSKTELASRLLSSEGRINSKKLRDGQLDEEDYANLARAATLLAETNLYIDDSPDVTPMRMLSKLRRLKNLGLVVIDHLQLMHSDDRKKENRVQEVNEITRNIKNMAKDLGCPVILCSQIGRADAARKDKRPLLSELKESGSIEQDADVVMLLHRDFYYDNQNTDIQNYAECNIAKNRHGESRMVKLGFDGQFTRFYPLEDRYDDPPAS